MSRFNGYSGHLVGGYSMVRRFSGLTKANWTALKFRGEGWFGACDQLDDNEKDAAVARGEVKRITVSVDSGTFDLAEVVAPGDRYSQIDASGNFPEMSRDYPNALGMHTFYYRCSGADFEIEVIFDIPGVGDV